MPFGPDLVPMFETLWYAMATLAPIEPAQEGQLLPITRYLRGRGQQVKASDLFMAQAYLQAVTRTGLGILNGHDASLSPTPASPPAPVAYSAQADPAETSQRPHRLTP